ncbi:MAG: efflux RND transporter periplasmic adaptor subunit [Acidobacteriaceae bacterium]
MLKTARIHIALAVTLGLLTMAGCKHAADASEASPTEAGNPLAIRVSPALLDHVRIGEARWQQVTSSEKVAARVETDASRVARIGSPVEGRITKILVLEGQHVRRGQVMATLHSTALSDAQFAFIKAYSEQQLSARSADRAKQLVRADVIGSAEVERREAELLQASAEVEAIRAKLQGLGMSARAIHQLETTRKLNSDYPIIATIAGTVLERKVTPGQIVQPADMAFLVADLSNVWLVAEVPEDEAGAIRVGKSVIASIPALPDCKIVGKLSFVSPVVNPETRTVQARMDLANPQGIFKPAMMALMTFESNPEKKQVIPDTAIVREENKDHVFVQTGPHKFVLREVELGMETGESRVLVSGLSANEKLVLDGAFHLNNQRKQNLVKGGD